MSKCIKCKKNNFLSICSKACDEKYCSWNDTKHNMEIDGYIPTFSSLTDSNGCNFSICIECGWIRGLNLKLLKKQVADELGDSDSDQKSESKSSSEPVKRKKSKK